LILILISFPIDVDGDTSSRHNNVGVLPTPASKRSPGVRNVRLRKVPEGYTLVPSKAATAAAPSRKRRASVKVKHEDSGTESEDADMDEYDEAEEDLSGIYIDSLYPLPNIRFKRIAPGQFRIPGRWHEVVLL
jgi:hypothetical protein